MLELFSQLANVWDSGFSDLPDSPLSHDLVEDSIAKAGDFFHLDESADTVNALAISDVFVVDDNSLYASTQLETMGITGQDSLDLMMAHEGASNILQGLNMDFSEYQGELCCDYMAGVRAGIDGIDISAMTDYLSEHQISAVMPFNDFRVEALEDGLSFAQEYMVTHHEAPDFARCLDEFQSSTSFENGELASLLDERGGQESIIQHYQDKLENDNDLSGNIDEYKNTIEHCFEARAEYDLLSDKIADGLSERLAKGETTGSIGYKSHNVSFTSRESMKPYEDYAIYDTEHPKLNPFGVYAMYHNHGNYPPNDFIEKPNLPNDFTAKELQDACSTICKAAGIKPLPVFITTETPNAEFQTMRGPFRFTIFDDRIYVNPDYTKMCIEKFGNTDSLLLDLAHEIGHELNSLYCGNLSRYMDEKLADMFAGIIADKMGIDIDVARQWNLWLYDGVGEGDYPPSEERWDIHAAGKYYSHFASVEDYKATLHDKHFLERVHDYSTDPVSTLAQQELDYQIHATHGIKEYLKDFLDSVKKYLLIERI